MVIDLDIKEAWTVRPGDVVFLRLPGREINAETMALYRETADALEAKTGVHLVLLDAGVEIVNPNTGDVG